LGEGTILDPFMGSGSTIAAAEAVGYAATGLELDTEHFRLAEKQSRAWPRCIRNPKSRPLTWN